MTEVTSSKGAGRCHKPQRLREIILDDKVPSHLRGWLQHQVNQIERDKDPQRRAELAKRENAPKTTINLPPGYELAHWRGLESKKGFSYVFTHLNTVEGHRSQHKFDDKGKTNKTPTRIIQYMSTNPGDLRDIEYARKVRNATSYLSSSDSCLNRSNNLSCIRNEKARSSQEYQSVKNITQDPYYSCPKAGGINLCKKIKFVTTANIEPKIRSVKVDYANKTVLVEASEGSTWKYDPKILSVEELRIIEDAVSKTTRAGLWLSCQFKLVVEGVMDQPGNEKFIQTMLDADMLQFAMVIGYHLVNRSKYESPVPTYQNPLDVFNDLLEAVIEAEPGSMSTELNRASDLFSKFSTIYPWTEFVMNNNVKAVLQSSNEISINGNVLDISLRFTATDWLGNKYYEDSDSSCIAQNPFLIDFQTNYSKYIKAHEELARIEQYAIVAGLLLNNCYSGERINSYKNPSIKTKIGRSGDEEKDTFLLRAGLQEHLIEREPNFSYQLSMAIEIAKSWKDQSQKIKAIDASLFSLKLLCNADDSIQYPVIKSYIAKCLYIIAQSVLGQDGNMPNLSEQQRFEIEELLGEKFVSVNNDTTTQLQIIKSILELGMSITIEISDWNLASQYCLIMFALLKNVYKLKEVEFQDKFFKEQWNIFSKQISMPEISQSSQTKLNEIIQAINESNSDPTLPDQFMKWLDTSNITQDESKLKAMQLNGFILYVTASIQGHKFKEEKNDDNVHRFAFAMMAFSIFFGSINQNCTQVSKNNVDWTYLCAFANQKMFEILKELEDKSVKDESVSKLQRAYDAYLKYKNNHSNANMQAALKIAGQAEVSANSSIVKSLFKFLIGDIYKEAGIMDRALLWKREAYNDTRQIRAFANATEKSTFKEVLDMMDEE